MLIADRSHYLDLDPDVAGPARRLGEFLSSIVRAASAGDHGVAWETTLPCRRRPAHRSCPGRMIVMRGEVGSPIRWQCSVCDDEGMISSWEDSVFDLRRRQLVAADPVQEIVLTAKVAGALRGLLLLDVDSERVVARMRARPRGGGAILAATAEDLESLAEAVAAEANHEPNRRRQQRLDAAFDALNGAAGGQ